MDVIQKQLSPSQTDKGKRLDAFLTSQLNSFTREKVKLAIKEGLIAVNSVALKKPDYRILGNELIQVNIKRSISHEYVPIPQAIHLPVIYEDEHMLIINKPAGISTHPSLNAMEDTVVNGLLYMNIPLSDVGGPLRAGIVHRLDKPTSGLLIIAKNNVAHHAFVRMFKDRTISKIYIACVYGILPKETDVIESLISRLHSDRKRMTTKASKGKEAITQYRVLKRFLDASMLMLLPKTGRTHQLRAQLSDMGYPIVGDHVYSKRKMEFKDKKLQYAFSNFEGVALFAYAISFEHPIYKGMMNFAAPFPEWLMRITDEQ